MEEVSLLLHFMKASVPDSPIASGMPPPLLDAKITVPKEQLPYDDIRFRRKSLEKARETRTMWKNKVDEMKAEIEALLRGDTLSMKEINERVLEMPS